MEEPFYFPFEGAVNWKAPTDAGRINLSITRPGGKLFAMSSRDTAEVSAGCDWWPIPCARN